MILLMYTYCIIGTGPAGITLAHELSKTHESICLIESGSRKLIQDFSGVKKVLSVGEIVIKEKSRERVWGGTSHTWAGLSAPLDPVDFKKWPITLQDVEPYYKRLDEYGFAPYENFEESQFDAVKKQGDFVLELKNLEEKIFLASDPAVHFGKRYDDLLTKKNITVLLDSTVTHILQDTDKNITSVKIADINNNVREIRAKIFIICAGGLESTRLLLNANIGNNTNQVGKYLMNHPKNNFGMITLHKPIEKLPYLFGYLESGFAGYTGLRIQEPLQEELGILNSYIRFEPMFPWTDSVGVYSLITLTKRAKNILNYWKLKQKGLMHLKDYNETGDDNDVVAKNVPNMSESLIHVLHDIRAVAHYALHRIQDKKEIAITRIRIRNFMEMEPSEKNCMTLSTELDIYGNPFPVVNLTTTELDRKSMITLHELLRKEVERSKLGVYEGNLEHTDPWPINFDASHHLGGTVMGTDVRTSVVNTNLRVHSADNLYVCSGSVFPTSGCANPTYTICALAIRLADHLSSKSFPPQEKMN